MKVAIDIRRMTEFGVGTYIRNVVRTLARLDCDSQYFLIGSLAKVAECGALPPNFHAVELTGRDDTLKGNLVFRAIVRRLECDLVHVPHLFWIPRGLSCPYILTVHDLLEHMYGSRNASSLRRNLHFYLTRRVLRKAARVIAVSQFTKNEIQKLLAIPDVGAHPEFRHATDVDGYFHAWNLTTEGIAEHREFAIVLSSRAKRGICSSPQNADPSLRSG